MVIELLFELNWNSCPCGTRQRRMQINEAKQCTKKDAKTGPKNRGPDQPSLVMSYLSQALLSYDGEINSCSSKHNLFCLNDSGTLSGKP